MAKDRIHIIEKFLSFILQTNYLFRSADAVHFFNPELTSQQVEKKLVDPVLSNNYA